MIDALPRTDRLLETAAALRRVTESAAIAAARYAGMGPEIKNTADGAAVAAMDATLSLGDIACQVVIGEGIKDDAPTLEHGKRYGDIGRTALLHLAVDPVEGTTALALDERGAMSLAALSERGFPQWSGIPYMNKLVVGPEVAHLVREGSVRIDGDPSLNMQTVATELGIPISELKVAVLDRPRNARIIAAAQQLGVRLTLLPRGDVLPVIQICSSEGSMHMLYGSGGAPEAVLAGTLVAITGGEMQAMWDPQTAEQVAIAQSLGQHGVIMGLDELVGRGGELHFSATGITTCGDFLLYGCRFANGKWRPGSSLVASRAAEDEWDEV